MSAPMLVLHTIITKSQPLLVSAAAPPPMLV